MSPLNKQTVNSVTVPASWFLVVFPRFNFTSHVFVDTCFGTFVCLLHTEGISLEEVEQTSHDIVSPTRHEAFFAEINAALYIKRFFLVVSVLRSVCRRHSDTHEDLRLEQSTRVYVILHVIIVTSRSTYH